MSLPPEMPAGLPRDVATDFRVLVVGGSGMLAQDLLRCLQQNGFNPIGLSRPAIDITQSRRLLAVIRQVAPRVVVNCAAYTAVDQAEADAETAFAVNRDGSLNLARACRQLSLPLLTVSTDYVFDGRAQEPYREDAPVNPLSVYGKSKWEGEQAIRAHLQQHLIVRTAWLYGTRGRNFVTTMLDLARHREELRVVADQYGCPTWTGDLASALMQLVRRIRDERSSVPWGTYHFCGAGRTSWCGFAETIVDIGRRHEALRVKRVMPIPSDQYPVAAPRPLFSVLDCSKIQQAFAIIPRPWSIGLQDMLAELYGLEGFSGSRQV